MNPFYRPLLRYFILWMTGGTVLFYLLVRMATADRYEVDGNSGSVLIQMLAFLPFIWLLWKHWRDQMKVDFFFNQSWLPFRLDRMVLLWIGVMVFSFGVEGMSIILMATVDPELVAGMLPQAFFAADQPFGIHLFSFILAVVIGPCMEELVFRGLIMQRLLIKRGLVFAVVVSSLLFGLLHFESWLSASVFGIIMSVLFLQTKNLWVPMVFHICNNIASVLILEFQVDLMEIGSLDAFKSQIEYYLLALMVSPGLGYFIWKHWPRQGVVLPYEYNRQQSEI